MCGSTNNDLYRWIKHWRFIEDSLLHRNMKALGVDEFEFTVIDTVEYIDIKTLWIRESAYMDKYNRFETRYNVKHSICYKIYTKIWLKEMATSNNIW